MICNIINGDNLEYMGYMAEGQFSLVYIDPPFNTGKSQRYTRIQTEHDDNGDRVGYQGKKYRTVKLGTMEYADVFDDYLVFLEPWLIRAKQLLTANGSILIHLDYREVHYVKIMMGMIFGRDNFINEIVWAYDYGLGKSINGLLNTIRLYGM